MNYRDNVVETDVLVVGGGTAGCIAALSAARESVKVLIVESESALGGVATRAGIHRYYYGSPGGMQEQIDRETTELAHILGGRTMGFHPEAKKLVLSRLCKEAGVRVLLDSTVYEVLREGQEVTGVRAATREGVITIHAAVTIDSTANGSIVYLAGGRMRFGRDQDGVYHNYSLVPRRLRDGLIGYDNLDAGWVDPYDPRDVTRAFLKGREWIWQAYQEGLHYYGISSSLGYREGALIVGEKLLTIHDYIEDTSMPDVIARSYSHLDNHGFDTGNESEFSQLWISILGLFVKGLWCDIPYGSLLPVELDRVLVACRALSVGRDVSMGVRMQRDMHKVGEAAGLAAAMSVRNGTTPRRLPVPELQQRLLGRGVLEEGDLHRKHSRNLSFRHGALAGVTVLPEQAYMYVKELISYFGSEEQWKSIWLLAKRVDAVHSAELLKHELASSSTPRRLCTAIVLTLQGEQVQEPFLLNLLRERDPSRFNDHPKCQPFWVAALILLRMMRSTAATGEALQLLSESPSSVESVFILSYLRESIGLLPDLLRESTAEAVIRFVRRPELGGDYRMHGERNESLRWSLELHAAEVLAHSGHEMHEAWILPYEADARGYARSAARMLKQRLQEQEGESPVRPEPFKDEEYDVVVVGGGIAGVVSAVALAHQGRRILLVESSACLLNEVTRSRMTRWQVPPELSQDSTAAELTSCLERVGALREGEVEPVLAQLAVDRFIIEAGVTVLFEAHCLELRQEPLSEGRSVLKLALRTGSTEVRAQAFVDCSPEAVLLRKEIQLRSDDTRETTYTSVLVQCSLEQEVHQQLDFGTHQVYVRIRPTLYSYESYLDVTWVNISDEKEREDGLFLLDAVLTQLRSDGVLPAEAALAYIADSPWSLPAFTVETGGSGSNVVSNGGTILGAGLWNAPVVDMVKRTEPWKRDVLVSGQLLLAGEQAARAISDFTTVGSPDLNGRKKSN
ncbi:FAD-dependent oxidoreductase [Paenibacillus sp. GD4]|uniref:FAD-dependent oxidoreductase n=1 Tax=Paenibacillus sp. GD4 TaxID=3068890 RepID=UPI0027966A5D|nr:FAD-dependent oxidoreductase [Paenibacillus sp. GD4]MDQ1914707.1 FAD-dependent oxidoreductase [Paenibacillus sp. GD4]